MKNSRFKEGKSNLLKDMNNLRLALEQKSIRQNQTSKIN